MPMPVFESPADSLEWVILTNYGEQKMDAIFKYCTDYLELDMEKTALYVKELYMMAKNESHTLMQGKGALCMGDYHYVIGNIDSALYFFDEALSFMKMNDDENLARLRTRLSLAQLRVLEYEKALDNILKALAFFEKNDKPSQTLSAYCRIATIYEAMANYNKQEEYLLKALDLITQDNISRDDKGIFLINYALFKMRKKDFEDAEKFGKQAIEEFRNAGKGSLRFLGSTLYRMALILILQHSDQKNEQIIKYLDETYAIAEQIQNHGLMVEALMGKASFLVENKEYQTAYQAAKKAETLIDTTDKLVMNDFYYLIACCALRAGKIEETNNYFNLYNKSKDELQDQLLAEKTVELEVYYETEKKELEIVNQKNIIAKQNLQRNFLIGGITTSIIILVMLWFMLRLRNRRNRALAEMNATKDKFFSIISHDIKNPALAQRDAIQQILDNVSGWNAETLAQYLHELLKSADGEVELIYNLLNWAQVQTGRMAFMPTSCDLAAILRPEITIIQEMAKNKELTFISQIQENAMAIADRNMIATVVRNLLTNAVKFTPAGGTVTLEISSGTGVARNVHGYTISVSDTGIGMSEKQLQNLFCLDSTHSSKGTANESGSGLGLIVCKEMLDKHGSALHIASEEAKGSKFWFELS
jgi:signal transduction histidine kinase